MAVPPADTVKGFARASRAREREHLWDVKAVAILVGWALLVDEARGGVVLRVAFRNLVELRPAPTVLKRIITPHRVETRVSLECDAEQVFVRAVAQAASGLARGENGAEGWEVDKSSFIRLCGI